MRSDQNSRVQCRLWTITLFFVVIFECVTFLTVRYFDILGPIITSGTVISSDASKSDPEDASCNRVLFILARTLELTEDTTIIRAMLNAVGLAKCHIGLIKDSAQSWSSFGPDFQPTLLEAQGRLSLFLKLPLCSNLAVCRYLPSARRQPSIVFDFEPDSGPLKSVRYYDGRSWM